MKHLRYLLLLALSALSSCNFDHLYYQTSLLALVQIDVDWESSHITPNGVTAFVYDAAGDLYTSQLSSDPYVVYLKLPAGTYTVVLHNNSISELDGVELRNISTLESASIYAIERDDEPSFEVEGEDMLFVEEPDDVVSCTISWSRRPISSTTTISPMCRSMSRRLPIASMPRRCISSTSHVLLPISMAWSMPPEHQPLFCEVCREDITFTQSRPPMAM
ncbi:MAG: DUF5119 domain-containing protein [Rikenellaceae bacterium]